VLQNRLGYAFQTLVDILVRESNDRAAVVGEPFSAGLIVFGLCRVRVAVDFDHQGALVTEEVDDEMVDWMLATELKATEAPISQSSP